MDRATSAEIGASTFPITCIAAGRCDATRAEKPAGMMMTASSVPFAASARARATVGSLWIAIRPLLPTAPSTPVTNRAEAAPRSALTTPSAIALEFPLIPPKIALKMKARPSGTTIPMSRADRSRSRALRSLPQISRVARICSCAPSVAQCPAGEVQEDRFQVGLGDLHGPDGRPRRRGARQDLREMAPGVLDHHVDALVGGAGLAHPRLAGEFRGGLGQVARGQQPDPVPLADQAHQLVTGALGDQLPAVDDAHPVTQPLRLLHVVGGVQDRNPFPGQPFDAFEDRA